MEAQFEFEGLDDAEAHPPDLPAGKHLLSIRKNDVFTYQGNTHMNVEGEVLQTNNPKEVKVGSVFRAKIPFLKSTKFPDSQKGLKILRTYLAAALGVPADEPPPPDVAPSWQALAKQVINGDPTAMEGDRVMVVASPGKKNPEYCDYKFLPAPAE